MQVRTVAGFLVAVLAVAALGTFGGMWGWNEWREHQVRSAAQAASAAAEAERRSPRGVQREVVKAFLFDPESAQFRGDVPAVRGRGVWCGEVNARNRMGGMVGFTRYVAEVDDGARVYFEDGRTSQRDSDALFEGKWRAFCVR